MLGWMGGYRHYISSCLNTNVFNFFLSLAKCCPCLLFVPSFTSLFMFFSKLSDFSWHSEHTARSKNHNLKWSINGEGE